MMLIYEHVCRQSSSRALTSTIKKGTDEEKCIYNIGFE